MIIDRNAAGQLLEQLEAASADEAVATKALTVALADGLKDHASINELTERMTEAHNKKMDILDQLQRFRLDK